MNVMYVNYIYIYLHLPQIYTWPEKHKLSPPYLNLFSLLEAASTNRGSTSSNLRAGCLQIGTLSRRPTPGDRRRRLNRSVAFRVFFWLRFLTGGTFEIPTMGFFPYCKDGFFQTKKSWSKFFFGLEPTKKLWKEFGYLHPSFVGNAYTS